MMPERANRTFICSVLFLDIAEYSKKPVSEQIQLKDRFNALIAESIRDISPNDRIILDTGDGVAINFLGDPEDALFVAMSLREAFAPKVGAAPRLPTRIGINLGPVRLVRDLNSQPNIIGDGINVAQRVMGFAQAGQILVSRSYYEVVLHISEGYTKLFNYEGSRTDKHVREHEVYSVGYSNARSGAIRSPAERARDSTQEGRQQANSATLATGPARPWSSVVARIEPWLNNRAIALGTATMSVAAFAIAVVINLLGHNGEVSALSSQSDEQKKSHSAASQDSAAPGGNRKPADGKNRIKIPRLTRDQQAVALPSPKTEAAEKKEAKPSAFAFFSREKSAPKEAEPAGAAVITLAIAPWGEVYVDGERIGVSPPVNEVEVAAGKRKIEIKNGNFPVYTQVVDVKADQKLRIKHKFN